MAPYTVSLTVKIPDLHIEILRSKNCSYGRSAGGSPAPTAACRETSNSRGLSNANPTRANLLLVPAQTAQFRKLSNFNSIIGKLLSARNPRTARTPSPTAQYAWGHSH